MDARNKKKKITAAQAIQLLELHKKKQNDLHRRNTAVYKPANASVSMVALDKMWVLEDALNSVCLPPGEDAEIGYRIGETKTKKP